MSRITIGLLILCLMATQGCKTGYNKRYIIDSDDVETPDCDQTPNNADISTDAKKVFDLIASLTCNDADTDGALMGQNLGYGNQIVEEDGTRSYEALIDTDALTKKPALISIDYEHDKIFTADQLLEANVQLKAHWDAGGIVMVSWMPLNPWENDASNPANSPGNTDQLLYSNDVNLADLIVEGSAAYTIWRRKLDAIATALQDLEDKDVAVMWRPLPAMNTTTQYWWGLEASYTEGEAEEDQAKLYVDIWKDMYTYFTETKELNNLIWVYSPAEGGDLPDDASVGWAYPGDGYVDVVGAIAQNDFLNIPDYEAINAIGKPLGMAQYNPAPLENFGKFSGEGTFAGNGAEGQAGLFDNRQYGKILQGSYENVAFWITWHSYELEDGHSNLALVHNQYAEELAERKDVLDLTTVINKKMR